MKIRGQGGVCYNRVRRSIPRSLLISGVLSLKGSASVVASGGPVVGRKIEVDRLSAYRAVQHSVECEKTFPGDGVCGELSIRHWPSSVV